MLLLLVPLLLPSIARAGKPAVKEINGRVFGGYRYESTGRAEAFAINQATFLAGTNEGTWLIGGVVTTPIFDFLGGRVFVSGGQNTLEFESELGFPGNTFDGGRVDAGGVLFVRNPEFGYFDLGYRFGWESSSNPLIDRVIVNALIIDAGFYIPDQGPGPFDWDFHFDYARPAVHTIGPTQHASQYTVDGLIGWYIGRSVRLAAGVHWLATAADRSPSQSDLRGVAELAWLLPIGERRLVSVELFGSGGRIDTDLAAPFGIVDRSVYSIGINVTLSYPGATSLVELIREYY
jgi:hypothetical protein